MALDHATNRGRVTKILNTLALIDKSATSNDAEEQEVTDLLAPLYQKLGITQAEPSEERAPTSPEGRIGTTAPPWVSVMDMANEANLKDLTRAMGIYMHRLSEEVFNS